MVHLGSGRASTCGLSPTNVPQDARDDICSSRLGRTGDTRFAKCPRALDVTAPDGLAVERA